tara:strand:+ start:457 stop:609 length:153 start_codon:yes stop_codon:yes gene_type:complete
MDCCKRTERKKKRADFLKSYLKERDITEAEWKKELNSKYKKVYKKKKVIT